MEDTLKHLRESVRKEQEAQERIYQCSDSNGLKELKRRGLALHPFRIRQKTYGYADYPECSFSLPYPVDTRMFKAGHPVELFLEGETAIKALLLELDGDKGTIRLYSGDFPDWMEEKNTAIRPVPDNRTFDTLLSALHHVTESKSSSRLFFSIHQPHIVHSPIIMENTPSHWRNVNLNEGQKKAVTAMLQPNELTIIHGPPGTGKTTTLAEGIYQLVKSGKKVLYCAPANAAVDHATRVLANMQLPILRVGNQTRIDSALHDFSLEGKLAVSDVAKTIKKLRKQADEYRRMATRYRRQFGKEEREQRRLLLKEVKSIQKDVRELESHHSRNILEQARVILGTPVGLHDALASLENVYDILVLDEAGQCWEPFFWVVQPLAERIVLAGDHCQLPPTILSEDVMRSKWQRSILESCVEGGWESHFLSVQYRMPETVAAFSSRHFYEGKLLSEKSDSANTPLLFFDTAGTGYDEERSEESGSISNPGEIELVEQFLRVESTERMETVFISPYAAQVASAKNRFEKNIRISTIDSFQGQEADRVIVSLVRSNSENQIGFLKEYRRLNVALTRAKKQLVVIGDSSTLSTDAFYDGFVRFTEECGGYRSAWELMG
jgi:ATP-dependent RNA/DNA helicase IGHMBP2